MERTSVTIMGPIVMLFTVMLVCVACGDNGSEENCGNARLDEGEYCDTAVSSGEWMCPLEEFCKDTDPCTHDLLVGEGCQARCEVTPIIDAIDDDGCCPDGADFNSDSDCLDDCDSAIELQLIWMDDYCQQHSSCCLCDCYLQNLDVDTRVPCSCKAKEACVDDPNTTEDECNPECIGERLTEAQECLANQSSCRSDLTGILQSICE